MPRPARLRQTDDLFELFPDLPRPRWRRADSQRAHVLQMIAVARERIAENAKRQMEASQHLRTIVAARQQRRIRRRPS